jgi:hypothetical protein
LDAFSISTQITAACPLLGLLIKGAWMLWVTGPEATAAVGQLQARQGRYRSADPGIAD